MLNFSFQFLILGMIRIIRENDSLLITGEPRGEYELENTELLYTYEDLDWTPEMKERVRPYIKLGEGELYKPELLERLPEILYRPVKLIPSNPGVVKEVLGELKIISQLLGIEEKKLDIPEIIYTCDLWNYVDSLYPGNLKLLRDYYELGKEEKELIKKIYTTPGNLKKLDLSRNSDWERVYEFLPEFVQENLAFFGSGVGIIRKQSETPEYRDQRELGPGIPKLQDEIYKEFKLGEVFLDSGASGVKERLQKIYEQCEIKKTAKMKDLEEFFTMVPCWSRGKRGFRIDFRKL